MTKLQRSLAGLLVAGATIVPLACGGGEEATNTGANEAQLAGLEAQKAQLDAKRAEMRAKAEELAAARAAEEPDPAQIEQLQGDLTQLEGEAATLAEDFGGELVAFINALEIVQGEPLTPDQQRAIRMKSDEDLELAREWIDKGGDYRRAIEIYEAQLLYDPDNERLQEAMQTAQEMRFMTEERFAQVEKGMTQAQVKEILGPVNLHNVKEYEERGVVAWFYPKDGGGAAGVWFRAAREGDAPKVYQIAFDATGGAEGEAG